MHGDRRSVGREISDIGPINHFDGAVAAIKAFWHQPPDKSLQAHIRTGHTPKVADLDQLYVIYADDPLAVYVDQLIVEYILAEQNFAVAPDKRAQIEYRRFHLRTVQAKLRDVASRHKKIAAAIAGDQPDDRRMLLAAIPHDHVLDRRDRLIACVEDRPVQNLRNVKHN